MNTLVFVLSIVSVLIGQVLVIYALNKRDAPTQARKTSRRAVDADADDDPSGARQNPNSDVVFGWCR